MTARRAEALRRQDEALRAEAELILYDRGVASLAGEYGQLHAGGSFALRLMTWRDLDLHLRAPALSVERFLDLGSRLGGILLPRKMSFTNQRDFPSTEPIAGLYWGIRTGDIRAGAWKIDLWALEPDVWENQIETERALASSLTEEHRTAILEIKSAIWNHPDYRKTIGSQDVYEAVRDGGARSVEEFWSHVGKRSRRSSWSA